MSDPVLRVSILRCDAAKFALLREMMLDVEGRNIRVRFRALAQVRSDGGSNPLRRRKLAFHPS